MSRKYELRLAGEEKPILIVAPHDADAYAQAREIKRTLRNAKVISFYEVFDRPVSNFERQFNSVFAQ